MNAIQTLTGILGLSFVSGINLYAAVLVVGLGIRYHLLTGLPPALNDLAHPLAIGVAGFMYLVEFVVDKVPYVSALWDAGHTFIRPLGGALLALGVAAHASPIVQIVSFLLGGSVALGTHSTKMGIRVLAHASPEPVSNSILSVGEDLSVVGLILLVYTHPMAALAVLLTLLTAIAIFTPLLYRILVFMMRGVAGRVMSWFPGPGDSAPAVCPAWLEGRLAAIAPARDERVFPCFARSCDRAPKMKRGYLVRTGERYYFAYRAFGKPRVIPLGSDEKRDVSLHTGTLFDVLAVSDARNRKDTVYLAKDWSARVRSQAGAGVETPRLRIPI